jgi:hypothetical protein
MFFIPKKIKVGYQEREDTYSGKLSYIIYYDDKGTLRKETSWQSWRDERITPDDIDNVPTSGFVLNKEAGGRGYSSWDTRKTYCRVYDPRGFEFEIDIANLLYILENTNSIVGKGLEGEFVYGWEGKELVLIPTSAQDYKENKDKSDMMYNADFVKAKALKEGIVYTKKNGEKLMYLGKDEAFYATYRDRLDLPNYDYTYRHVKEKNKKFWFFKMSENFDGDYSDYDFMYYATLPKMYVPENEEIHPQYAEVLAEREKIEKYNPIISVKYRHITPEDLLKSTKKSDYVYEINHYTERWSKNPNFKVKDGKYAMPIDKLDKVDGGEEVFRDAHAFINIYKIRKIEKIVRYGDNKE